MLKKISPLLYLFYLLPTILTTTLYYTKSYWYLYLAVYIVFCILIYKSKKTFHNSTYVEALLTSFATTTPLALYKLYIHDFSTLKTFLIVYIIMILSSFSIFFLLLKSLKKHIKK